MTTFLKNFLRDDSGAAAAEYVLILAVIGAGIGAGAYFLGSSINTALSAKGSKLSSCAAATGTNVSSACA